jgi:hypothetical protein
MEIQLFSVEHAPRSLPIWQTILDDLGRPPAPRIARALGLSVRTVHRYNAAGSAPRVVCLSLFWLTRWGRSSVNAQAINDALVGVQLARSLAADLEQLRVQVRYLEALGTSGAANEPLLRGPHAR